MWNLIKILLTTFLIISLIHQSPHAQSSNFELRIIYPSDQREFDNLVQTIEQFWAPLFVSIIPDGLPRTTYFDKLEKAQYDLAVISIDEINSEYPPLYDLFAPNTFYGSLVYNLNSAQVVNSIDNQTITKFLDYVELYHSTSKLKQKIDLATSIQNEYNERILVDIPIVSPSNSIHYWTELNGFNAQEGLMGSLFLGLNWIDNPQKREAISRTISEIHYSPLDFKNLKLPIFYQTDGEYRFLQFLFPTLFLQDKNDKLHPNLASAFNMTELENGGREWMIYLNDNAFWSDKEPIDAYDVKFTLDLLSFDWIAATNKDNWKFLEEVSIINNTQVKIRFNDQSLNQQFTLAQEFILPEHILNDTSIYLGNPPDQLGSWNEFIFSPVTGGPYLYSSAKSETGITQVLEFDDSYWFPNELDSPNQIFNLTSNDKQDVYYFDFKTANGIPIKEIIFHASGSQSIDQNTLIRTFEGGNRDVVEIPYLDADSPLFSNPEFNSATIPIPGGGITIALNLQNPHLRNYDIRKALTSAINRNVLVDFFGKNALLQATPISAHYTEFYDPKSELAYSYDTAKNLFRANGYDALETVIQETSYQWPWQRLPISYISILGGLFILALLSTNYRKK